MIKGYRMVSVYILKLEQGKYYVGKTHNPQITLDSSSHSNIGWTTLYKPIKIIEIIPDCDNKEVDKYTRQYMSKYGIDNVRGGIFVSNELDQATVEHLRRTIKNKNKYTCCCIT
jgi:cellular nucleic acid-binding protein